MEARGIKVLPPPGSHTPRGGRHVGLGAGSTVAATVAAAGNNNNNKSSVSKINVHATATKGTHNNNKHNIVSDYSNMDDDDGYASHLLKMGVDNGSEEMPGRIPAVKDGDDPEDDPVLDEVMMSGLARDSHILSHATEGFYIPVEFSGPPLFDPEGKVRGGWIGSSRQLMDELLRLSPALGIDLRTKATRGRGMLKRGLPRHGGNGRDGFDVSEATIQSINGWDQSNGRSSRHRYEIERQVWFVLYEAARISLEHKSAIIMR